MGKGGGSYAVYMTSSEHLPAFGELFLDEPRKHTHTLPLNYAGAQRVRSALTAIAMFGE